MQLSKLIVVLATIPSLALADGERVAPDFTAEAGLSLMRFKYSEFSDSGQLLDRETGYLPGLTLGLTKNWERWSMAGEFSHHAATIDHQGKTQGGAPVRTRSAEQLTDYALRASYWLDAQKNYAVYAGVGYRKWQRDIHGTAAVAGLNETYTWWSGSLGAKVTLFHRGLADLALDARLTRTLRPSVQVNFSGLFDNQRLELGERIGARLGLPVRIGVGERSAVVMEPYYEYWAFGRSRTATLSRSGLPLGTVFEPKSKTSNFGLNVTWSQAF